MSDHKIYTVTVRVAASYNDEAKRIAERLILEEFTQGCAEVIVDTRDLDSEVNEDIDATAAATELCSNLGDGLIRRRFVSAQLLRCRQ